MDKEILYGLIANPAQHSLSPLIQNMAFQDVGLHAHYLAFEVEKSELATAVWGLKALKAGGFNVSTPYKTAIIPYLNFIDPQIASLKAINTVKIINNSLQGFSTDGDGFWQTLKVKNRTNTVLIGTGGAARSIMSTAKQYGVKNLFVFNRYSNSWAQKAKIVQKLSQTKIHSLNNSSDLQDILSHADLVINATTVGMKANDPSILSLRDMMIIKPQATIVDIIYRHKTQFLKSAESLGYKTIDGIPMLIGQAALSFEIWTGKKADFNQIREVIKTKIKI